MREKLVRNSVNQLEKYRVEDIMPIVVPSVHRVMERLGATAIVILITKNMCAK